LEAVSKELAEKTASLKEIKASRKDLVDYLIRKQKRVKNLYDRVEKETSLFNQAKSKLTLEIDDLNLELERLKKNYDNMISFPTVQETIQQEMEKILKIVNEKKQKLENKYRKELLSEVLLRKVVNSGGKKLKEGDFLSVNGYKLKKTNEYGFVFVDSD
jgi:translation elongation factor EF-G